MSQIRVERKNRINHSAGRKRMRQKKRKEKARPNFTQQTTKVQKNNYPSLAFKTAFYEKCENGSFLMVPVFSDNQCFQLLPKIQFYEFDLWDFSIIHYNNKIHLKKNETKVLNISKNLKIISLRFILFSFSTGCRLEPLRLDAPKKYLAELRFGPENAQWCVFYDNYQQAVPLPLLHTGLW